MVQRGQGPELAGQGQGLGAARGRIHWVARTLEPARTQGQVIRVVVFRVQPGPLHVGQELIDVYPQNPMQASARFFIGNLHYQNQEWKTAREKLYRVVTDYPESIPAQLAENRLRDMRQNGH